MNAKQHTFNFELLSHNDPPAAADPDQPAAPLEHDPPVQPDMASSQTVQNAAESGEVMDVEPSAAPSPESGEQLSEPVPARRAPQPVPEILSGKSVWIVDAHALIYQVFHAMPEMTGPNGQPVGAIHGFIRDLLTILEKHQPDFLICAFDHSDITFRHDVYQQYKHSRASMPEDLRPQIANIQRMLKAMGIPYVAVPGFEADDILATVARQTRESGGTCYLVTPDKDCWQLIGPQVYLFNIRKNLVLDDAALLAQWGILPEQVVDFQSLVGDSTDNVPGVPLIGPKIAGELLRTYGTLEGVFEHLDEIKGAKRRDNLRQYREQALVSRELVRLADDVPLELDWQAARVGGLDMRQAAALCQEFGFRRLVEQLNQLAGGSAQSLLADGQNEIGSGEGAEAGESSTASLSPLETVDSEPWKTDYRELSPSEVDNVVAACRAAGRFSLGLQTSSSQPRWARLEGLALCWEPGQAVYLPLGDSDGVAAGGTHAVSAGAGEGHESGKGTFPEAIRMLLEDPAVAVWGHDLKHAVVTLRSYGVTLQGLDFDSMVADYLLAPGERTHEADDLARRYFGRPLPGADVPTRAGKKAAPLAAEQLGQLACQRADLTMRLQPRLAGQLVDESLEQLYRDVELPLVSVLAEMEWHGIRIDVAGLMKLSERFTERMARLQQEIQELAGEPFNIDSPRQLGQILFQRLQLPVIKRTPLKEPSTDAEVLEELALRHPLPAKIVEYRQASKLKGTYVDALPQLMHPLTGRVHTSLRQDVAATGRLSSKDPNLQNIPVRTAEGREIRAAFLPAAGWKLLTADYSQIELRILAHFSRDEALLSSFARDEDIHARVAREVFQLSEGEVPAELRRRAKAVNFGIIYGQTAFGLAKALVIDKGEAAAFIDAYLATYPGVQQFVEKTLEECRKKGYVSTILGRRRGVEGVRDASRRRDARFRTLPERIAINTVIQGSAADLIKLAMISIHRRLAQEHWQARMLLQIHDELVFEVPSDELTPLSRLVADEMTSAARLDVPLKVDIKSGDNWSDCDDVV